MAVLPYQQDCENPPPFTLTAAASGAAADDHQPRMMVKPMFAVTSFVSSPFNTHPRQRVCRRGVMTVISEWEEWLQPPIVAALHFAAQKK
jgi:hypothetical protein